jgi:hypothetical protein
VFGELNPHQKNNNQENNFSTIYKRMITIKPFGGLCNRMRAIDSVREIAKKTDMKVRIIWENNHSLFCDFNRLFITPPGFTIAQTVNYMPQFYIKMKRQSIEHLRKRNIFLPLGYDKYFFDKDILALKNKGYDFSDLNWNEKIYIETQTRFLRGDFSDFIPIPELQDKIDKIAQSFGEHMIGVHIRRGDHKICIRESPLENFIESMEMELELDREVQFYLATDSFEIEEKIRTHFPQRIISNKRILRRDSTKGIQDALIDLKCLSLTQKIIGSYWSSFSETAALMGHIDLLIVRKSQNEILV